MRFGHILGCILFFAITCFSAGIAQTNTDSLLQIVSTSQGKTKFTALKQLSKAFQQNNPPKAFEFAQQQRQVAIGLKDKSLEAEALNDMAVPVIMMQENKKAIGLLQESVRIYDSLRDDNGRISALNNLGIAWSQSGAHEKSLAVYLEVLLYCQRTGKINYQGRVYMSLGLVYHDLKKYHHALGAEYKAKEIFVKEKDEKLIANVNVNLGIIHTSMGNYKKALDSYEEALEYYQKHNNIFSLALTKFNIAQLYKDQKMFEEAQTWYAKALPLIRQINNVWAEASVYLDLAEISMKQQKWQAAIQLLSVCDSLNRISGDDNLQSRIHYSLFGIYDTLDHYQEALFHYKKYSALQDSIQTLEKTKIIEGLTIQYESEQKEAENNLLKIDLRAHKTKFWIMIGLSLAFGVISVFIIIVLLLKRKNIRLIKEQAEKDHHVKAMELEMIQAEKRLHEEEIEKKQVEIQLKEQELVFQALQKIELTNINRSVQERLLPFNYKISNKKDQAEFLQILNEVTREANKDPLADFEILFTQSHQKFNENLLKRCPSLTKSELQVCALLRINLSTKDISRLLNISAGSVDITRHRIRQKLDLDTKESLTTFLMSL
ncbi:MAG: tetratricopeptide repeat protein [Bacteroidales bacterium]